jgi:hypothetical protein
MLSNKSFESSSSLGRQLHVGEKGVHPGLISTRTPFENDRDGIGVDQSACQSAGNEAPRLMLQMIHWQPCTLGTLKHLMVLFLLFDSHQVKQPIRYA